MTKILSVGGSIIAPDKPDSVFLSEFVTMCKKWLDSDKENRLMNTAGGGQSGEGGRFEDSNMETYIAMCKIDSQWEFALFLRKLKQGLCINLEVWDG